MEFTYEETLLLCKMVNSAIKAMRTLDLEPKPELLALQKKLHSRFDA